VPRNWSGWLDL